jgi:hypothetical protein
MISKKCIDCGKNAQTGEEYFMVHDQLWEKYGAGNELLCISCFEKRMGRKLKSDDLQGVFVNEIVNPNTSKLLLVI